MQKNNSESQNKENTTGDEGNPRFGRLLIVLIAVVGLIVFITFASESYYS